MQYAPEAFEAAAAAAAASELAEYRTKEEAVQVSRAMGISSDAGPYPIFSREPWADSPARKWVVASFAEMGAWLARVPREMRKVHELVPSSVPCRFVADLDCKTPSAMAATAFPGGKQDLFDKCVPEMCALLQEAFALSDPPRAAVADSSRPDKLSLHVTFPNLILENWPAVAAVGAWLAHRSKTAGSPLHHVLDENVYARQGGTLRTLFCTAHGKQGAYLTPWGEASRDFRLDAWLDSLVTYVHPDADASRIHAVPAAVASAPATAARKRAAKHATPSRATPEAFGDDVSLFTAVRDALAFALVAPHDGASVAADDVPPERDSFCVMLKAYPCVFKNGEPHAGNRMLATWFLQNQGPAGKEPPRVVGLTVRCMNAAAPCRRGVDEFDEARVREADALLREVFQRVGRADAEAVTTCGNERLCSSASSASTSVCEAAGAVAGAGAGAGAGAVMGGGGAATEGAAGAAAEAAKA